MARSEPLRIEPENDDIMVSLELYLYFYYTTWLKKIINEKLLLKVKIMYVRSALKHILLKQHILLLKHILLKHIKTLNMINH